MINNFEKACVKYSDGKIMMDKCEMVYGILLASDKPMTATEIAEACDPNHLVAVQAVSKYLRMLGTLDLVERQEIETGETVTITPPVNPYYQPWHCSWEEVFDENGKSLGVQKIMKKMAEPYEIKVKKILFSVKAV